MEKNAEMDELASLRPKQSEDNPIPKKEEQYYEERKKKAKEEKEKNYYANKKPVSSGVYKRNRKLENKNDPFDDLYKATPQEITELQENFPEVHTNAIYIQQGEKCYFSSAAGLVQLKVTKNYLRESLGISVPGIWKGTRWGSSISWKKEAGERRETNTCWGMLYVTNRMTIFVERLKGFDKKHSSISAIKLYEDGFEIQYGSKTYILLVQDAIRLYKLYELLR